jgi:HEAT repeat protein
MLIALCFALLAFPPGIASAASPAVEDLRRALAMPMSDAAAQVPDPEVRRRMLAARVAGLEGVADLRAALLLGEWRDEDADPVLAAIDRAVRAEVARRLEQILRQAVEEGDSAGRLAAVRIIGDVANALTGSRAGMFRDFGPSLAALARGSDPELRVAAAQALSRNAAEPGVAAATLGTLFESDDPVARRAAARGLAELVERATREFLHASAAGMETAAHSAAHMSQAVIPVVCGGLADPDDEVRRLSVVVLQETAVLLSKVIGEPRRLDYRADAQRPGPADLQAVFASLNDQVPGLTQALRDPDPDVRLLAHEALETVAATWAGWQDFLGRMPGANLAVGQAKLIFASDKRPSPPAPPSLPDRLTAALPALEASLRDPDVRSRRAALDALESLGPAAAPAIPALVGILSDADPFVRWAAARVLGKVGATDPEVVVPGLVPMLCDPDLDVRLTAAEALRQLGPGAVSAVPALVQVLEAGDADMRLAAVRALQGIGTAGRAAVDTLAAALKDPDIRVRQAAAELLGQYGPVAGQAREDLRRAAGTANPDVCKAASDALLQIPCQAPVSARAAPRPAATVGTSTSANQGARQDPCLLPTTEAHTNDTPVSSPARMNLPADTQPNPPVIQAAAWQPARTSQGALQAWEAGSSAPPALPPSVVRGAEDLPDAPRAPIKTTGAAVTLLPPTVWQPRQRVIAESP